MKVDDYVIDYVQEEDPKSLPYLLITLGILYNVIALVINLN